MLCVLLKSLWGGGEVIAVVENFAYGDTPYILTLVWE